MKSPNPMVGEELGMGQPHKKGLGEHGELERGHIDVSSAFLSGRWHCGWHGE